MKTLSQIFIDWNLGEHLSRHFPSHPPKKCSILGRACLRTKVQLEAGKVFPSCTETFETLITVQFNERHFIKTLHPNFFTHFIKTFSVDRKFINFSFYRKQKFEYRSMDVYILSSPFFFRRINIKVRNNKNTISQHLNMLIFRHAA